MAFTDRFYNRGSISTGYDIDNSLVSNSVLNSGNPARLTRTHTGTGNRKTFTISFWHKKGKSSHSNGASYKFINSIRNESGKYPGLFLIDTRITSNKSILFATFADEDANNVAEANIKGTSSLVDHSAWYHFVIAYDTTQGSAAARRTMYINGVEQIVTQNQDLNQHHQSSWNDDTLHCIGAYVYDLGNPSLGGYIAELHNIDGLKLDASYFGEFDTASGIWKPKEYAGAYGTNGFRLQFKEAGTGQNASGLGADTSGNNHHFATIGHTATSQSTDTPTNNFCTLIPAYAMTYPLTISEGGTKTVADDSVSQWQSAKGSMAVDNGKWYWEYSGFTELNTFLGIQSADANGVYNTAYTWNLPLNDNSFYIADPSGRTEGFSTSKATSDVWAIALNMDDGEISFYRNGTQQNSTVSIDGLIGNGPYTPLISQYASATNASTNFGGHNSGKAISSAATDENGYGTFEYAPPSGYYSLCSKNLAEYG